MRSPPNFAINLSECGAFRGEWGQAVSTAFCPLLQGCPHVRLSAVPCSALLLPGPGSCRSSSAQPFGFCLPSSRRCCSHVPHPAFGQPQGSQRCFIFFNLHPHSWCMPARSFWYRWGETCPCHADFSLQPGLPLELLLPCAFGLSSYLKAGCRAVASSSRCCNLSAKP